MRVRDAGVPARSPGRLKSALTDQSLFAGLGNLLAGVNQPAGR
ncbi:hypothetical protein [Actinoallomurus spadix]|nr:hypothetical protein [Actinoallomurus spadix]